MEKYMVIATIKGIEYLTSINASSLCGAEHKIIDMGICGRHEYAVEGCQAFGSKEMKTDHFISRAIKSITIGLDQLLLKIEDRNTEIRAKDEAEDRIKEIEKQMANLKAELEAAKKILVA